MRSHKFLDLNSMRIPLRLALTLIIFSIWFDSSLGATLEWSGDFETGDFSQYKSNLYLEGKYSSKRIVTDPVRTGKYAVELSILGLGRDVKERAELHTDQEGDPGVYRFYWDGPEYWVGFSFYFKKKIGSVWTFFQFHPPDGSSYPGGCKVGGNTFSVWGSPSKGSYSDSIAVRVIEDGTFTKSAGGAAAGTVQVWKEPITTGVWNDFVVNIKISTKGQGFYKIWKDGTVIYEKYNLTNTNIWDACGNLQTDVLPDHLQMQYGALIGLYTNKEPVERQIYYDEVKIAVGENGYDLVAPGGGVITTPKVAPPLPPINLNVDVEAIK